MIGRMVRPRDDMGEIGAMPDLGAWARPRISFPVAHVGLVMEVENFWGEDWYRVLLPSGTGWVKEYWVEEVR